MRTLIVCIAFLAVPIVVAQDFEISFIDKSEIMKFAKETVKVSINGDNIPDEVEKLFVDSGKKTTLKDHLSLKEFVDTAEKDIEEMLDLLSTDKKNFEEKQQLVNDFSENIKKLEELVEKVAKEIETKIIEKQKVKRVFNSNSIGWEVEITYPRFRYEYVIDEQNKAYESFVKDFKEEEKEVKAKIYREKQEKRFKKEVLPKINKIKRRAFDNIRNCLKSDKAINELEGLYDDLQEYLEKDMVAKLRGEKSYADLQDKFEEHLGKMKDFPNFIRYLVQDMNKILNLVKGYKEFRLHPKDAQLLERIKNDLQKERKDYLSMQKKAQDVNASFASDKALARMFKRFKKKKEIKKFLASVGKSKKAIRKIDAEVPVKKFKKLLGKIRFIIVKKEDLK
ncbi:hypothetical protein [Candidatus Uabimicrobium amorphum]|uniref:DUF5667 domain-containing protein n=1 Tax=Uabimicrobium amorphum TaxID=2596890 RepID=A0A5S9IUR8_UABAM|nr:hypothetical protein [Candidatus Uabimicrobium amorphum]BBM87976.1 hypothetical protein UABAM_06392 [Candidatus Uabimicrobium amorphum]